MIVYSVITNDTDILHDQPQEDDCNYVLFTDDRESDTWQTSYAEGDREFCRWMKTHPEVFFDDEITMWLDGRFDLVKPPSYYKQFLKDDIALLKSPFRNCAYEEAKTCIASGMDNVQILERQIERYRSEGFPEDYGMVGTGIMIRRNTPKMKQFNRLWWQEIQNNSIRDQISFTYVAWTLGIDWGIIPDDLDTIRIRGHRSEQ
jgi:hypothetical protein